MWVQWQHCETIYFPLKMVKHTNNIWASKYTMCTIQLAHYCSVYFSLGCLLEPIPVSYNLHLPGKLTIQSIYFLKSRTITILILVEEEIWMVMWISWSNLFDFSEIVLDFSVKVFGCLCDIFWIYHALSNHCIVAWVTRPERMKGTKDKVKLAQRATNQDILQFRFSYLDHFLI